MMPAALRRASLSPTVDGGEDGNMAFSRIWLAWVGSVLLGGAAGWAQKDERPPITVFVNDSVGIDQAVLRRAENEAAGLFRRGGIEVHWRNCVETSDCRRPPCWNEFVLHIVPNGTTGSDWVFGEAFLGPDGRGRYADVFFNRLRDAQGNLSIAQLLGAVCAHELGHLLLGSHSHFLVGIMQPIWRQEALHRIAMGNLTFTPDQQRMMKDRLPNDSLAVTSIAGPGRLGLR
jgi:hypothetical protein